MVARLKKIFIIINNIWGCQSEIRYVIEILCSSSNVHAKTLSIRNRVLTRMHRTITYKIIQASDTMKSASKTQPRKQPGPRKSQPFNHRQENDSLLFRLYFVFHDQLMQLWCIDQKKKKCTKQHLNFLRSCDSYFRMCTVCYMT